MQEEFIAIMKENVWQNFAIEMKKAFMFNNQQAFSFFSLYTFWI